MYGIEDLDDIIRDILRQAKISNGRLLDDALEKIKELVSEAYDNGYSTGVAEEADL